ncbi:hypothetical protein [Tunturiibacter gelidiferens]|uniref:hypothetical protein n=1 Tax=Tunturiibacter gelidiferens TaxID=3069689 RepID=UPI003D9B5B3C
MCALASAGFASFVAMELWRHNTFGIWMPNTVYAKLWWPYQEIHTWHGLAAGRGSATMELVEVLFSPLLLFFWLLVSNRFVFRNHHTRVPSLISTLAVGAVLFGLVFGKNLGHRGRMTESLLPFIILLLSFCIANIACENDELLLPLVLAAMLHLGFWSVNAYFLAHRGNSVSIRKFENEGRASERIRQLLHHESLTIMIPDVGGAALCCDKLRILDIALLTNPTLAREGYGNFESYFVLNRPDIVVAHEVWAEASHLYKDGLLDNYSLVQAQQTRLFVRNDLYAQLLTENIGELHKITELPVCLGYSSADQEYSRKRDHVSSFKMRQTASSFLSGVLDFRQAHAF